MFEESIQSLRWTCVEIVPYESIGGLHSPSQQGRKWAAWIISIKTNETKKSLYGRPAYLDFKLYSNYKSYWSQNAYKHSYGFSNPDPNEYTTAALKELRLKRGQARQLAQMLSQQNPDKCFAIILEKIPVRSANVQVIQDQITIYKKGKRIK